MLPGEVTLLIAVTKHMTRGSLREEGCYFRPKAWGKSLSLCLGSHGGKEGITDGEDVESRQSIRLDCETSSPS